MDILTLHLRHISFCMWLMAEEVRAGSCDRQEAESTVMEGGDKVVIPCLRRRHCYRR